MASAGERVSMKQVVVKQRDFQPRQPKERQFKVLGNTATAKQPKEGGATYVDFQMEPLNLEEGEPNGRAFPAFYLDTAVDLKSGAPSYASPNGFAAFTQAVGDDCEPGVVEQEVVYTGKKAAKKGKTEETLTILDPGEVVAYLKAHDGAVVTAYEDLQKVSEREKEEYPNAKDKNVIRRWVIPEAQMAGSGTPVDGLPARRR